MKILFIHLSYPGHVIPTRGLAAGHQVAYLMSCNRKNKIAQASGNPGAVGIIEAYYGKQ